MAFRSCFLVSLAWLHRVLMRAFCNCENSRWKSWKMASTTSAVGTFLGRCIGASSDMLALCFHMLANAPGNPGAALIPFHRCSLSWVVWGGFFGVHQYFHILDTSELATPFGVGELLPHVGDLYFPFPRWFAQGDGIFDKGSVRW